MYTIYAAHQISIHVFKQYKWLRLSFQRNALWSLEIPDVILLLFLLYTIGLQNVNQNLFIDKKTHECNNNITDLYSWQVIHKNEVYQTKYILLLNKQSIINLNHFFG